jgi:hypothetical protein
MQSVFGLVQGQNLELGQDSVRQMNLTRLLSVSIEW